VAAPGLALEIRAVIAPLRRRHRLLIAVLALAVPAVFVLALLARPSETDYQDAGALAELGRTSAGTAVEIAPRPELTAPDVLAYWTLTPGDRLPDDAVLLGPVDATRTIRLELPSPPPGRILFYSLGHQEVVAVQPVEAAP